MSNMLELIKAKAVPAAVLRSAARGALSVPAAEMLEILVYLTRNSPVSDEAAITLVQWDESSAMAVLSSSDAPQEVLDYFWSPRNRRLRLMPALLENPRISEESIAEIAGKASAELANLMLASPRVRSSPAIMKLLRGNPHVSAERVAEPPGSPVPAEITGSGPQPPGSPVRAGVARDGVEVPSAATPEESHSPKLDSEAAHQAWEQEHAAEIASEEGRQFELTTAPDEPEQPATPETLPVQSAASQPQPVKTIPRLEPEQLSTLTRISRMNVAERVKQAFIGNKEERLILIRDGARVVQNAVLASPKITEPEVETFASAKNVEENVLREIAHNRRFIKNYAVQRNLVNNPKCPVEISLALVKNLLVYDLKTLRHSKGVPDVIRRVADNLYREKMSPHDK